MRGPGSAVLYLRTMTLRGQKKQILLPGVFLAVFLAGCLALCGARGYAFSGCEEGCQKCHTITDAEINVILKKIKAADAKIVKTQMSPVKGLWEVAIDVKGKRDVLYVDFSKKFMVKGDLVEVNASLNKTRERIDELNKDKRIDLSDISLKDALVLGSNKAEKRAIVFTDPD